MFYRLEDYTRCHHCNRARRWRDMFIAGGYLYCNKNCYRTELAHETA